MVVSDLDSGTKSYLERFTDGIKTLCGLNAFEQGKEAGIMLTRGEYSSNALPKASLLPAGVVALTLYGSELLAMTYAPEQLSMIYDSLPRSWHQR